MKSILFALVLTLSSSAFALSDACEVSMARTEKSVIETTEAIHAGIIKGEISKTEGRRIRRNLRVLILQAQATCETINQDSTPEINARALQIEALL